MTNDAQARADRTVTWIADRLRQKPDVAKNFDEASTSQKGKAFKAFADKVDSKPKWYQSDLVKIGGSSLASAILSAFIFGGSGEKTPAPAPAPSTTPVVAPAPVTQVVRTAPYNNCDTVLMMTNTQDPTKPQTISLPRNYALGLTQAQLKDNLRSFALHGMVPEFKHDQSLTSPVGTNISFGLNPAWQNAGTCHYILIREELARDDNVLNAVVNSIEKIRTQIGTDAVKNETRPIAFRIQRLNSDILTMQDIDPTDPNDAKEIAREPILP